MEQRNRIDELIHWIVLGMIPGVGSATAKKIVAYLGDVHAVFSKRKSDLTKIPGVGSYIASKIHDSNFSELFRIAEKEIKYAGENGIKMTLFSDPDYPTRLLACDDGPNFLFSKGPVIWNGKNQLAIVGTRNATPGGRDFCHSTLRELSLKGHNPVIISGLAFGIDLAAHRTALEFGLPTIAVLGHGLNQIYPKEHSKIARSIEEEGMLVTEFLTSDAFEKQNFLQRNRIIAGMADAVLVVESAKKGGAMVTADIAFSYGREVMAVPGRPNDEYSAGCNLLIKTNKAALVENGSDLEYQLGLSKVKRTEPAKQLNMFNELDSNEELLVSILKEKGSLNVDLLSGFSGIPVSKSSIFLLNLQLKGIIRVLPGNVYELI